MPDKYPQKIEIEIDSDDPVAHALPHTTECGSTIVGSFP